MYPHIHSKGSRFAHHSSLYNAEEVMGEHAARRPGGLFRPCIDLHGGKVKQIVGSSLTDDSTSLVTNFTATKTAQEYARMYKDDKLYGGHVIMLGSGCDEAAIAALQEFPLGLQIGGDISPENASRYLEAGASHVIVTSWLFRDGQLDFERLETLSRLVAKERLVIDLSCRRKPSDRNSGPYYVVMNKWQTFTDLEISGENLERLSRYCDEFLVHGVDVEGMKQGILEDLVVFLGENSPIPVTYAGGARNLEDLARVYELGKGKVNLTIGSALDIFGGSLSYADVVEFSRKRS